MAIPTFAESVDRLRRTADLRLSAVSLDGDAVADGDPNDIGEHGRIYIDEEGTVSVDIYDGTDDGFGNHSLGKSDNVLAKVWIITDPDLPNDVVIERCPDGELVVPFDSYPLDTDGEPDLGKIVDLLYDAGWSVAGQQGQWFGFSTFELGYSALSVAYKR